MQMVRTTVYLPKKIHKMAKESADRGNKSLSQFTVESLKKSLDTNYVHATDAFKATEEMIGLVKDTNVSDASTTINEYLYGENGVWRGSNKSS